MFPLGRGAHLLRRGGTFLERVAYLLRGGAVPLFTLLTLVIQRSYGIGGCPFFTLGCPLSKWCALLLLVSSPTCYLYKLSCHCKLVGVWDCCLWLYYCNTSIWNKETLEVKKVCYTCVWMLDVICA